MYKKYTGSLPNTVLISQFKNKFVKSSNITELLIHLVFVNYLCINFILFNYY